MKNRKETWSERLQQRGVIIDDSDYQVWSSSPIRGDDGQARVFPVKTCLQSPQDEKELAGIRVATHRGRPLGSDSFLSKMERLVGRRLRPLPVGRPGKKETAASPSDAKKGKA